MSGVRRPPTVGVQLPATRRIVKRSRGAEAS